ncbi:conserved hypothetical protein [Ricinus communis]|uniref:Uncharacterized protein n=1 Tax=Ricinus communis TaxID=3988 RepID=B9T782_RICCO|nr:conserved hypothetical protein [Ricinus communis]
MAMYMVSSGENNNSTVGSPMNGLSTALSFASMSGESANHDAAWKSSNKEAGLAVLICSR